MGGCGMDYESCGILNHIDERIEKKIDKWTAEYDKRRLFEIETITDHINNVSEHVNKVESKVDKIYDLMLQSAKDEAKEAKSSTKGMWDFFSKLFNRQNRKWTFTILTFVIVLVWTNADSVTAILKIILK